ncbi:MAG: SPASM domain-containing protein [Kiritimatiellia bacterium]
MRPFSLLVKPVGGSCNLSCRYCFYREHAGGRMNGAAFRRMLASYEALPFTEKAVALQGGEPLLSDPEVLATLDASPVQKSLQTNATLITDEIAAMLAHGGWLVGVSLDGHALHNRLRVTRQGVESFRTAIAGIRRLEAAGVDYNLLTVVSRANVREPADVYRYLRDNFATRYHQYIECTGPSEEIDGDEWGAFLIGLFDEWIVNDAHTVSIRLFDSIVSQLVRGFPTQCSFADSCAQYLVVEHDGSVYPCDFHVRDDLKLGNIETHSWEEMLDSPLYRAFAARKCANLPEACRTCDYSGLCHGDCPRNRAHGRSILCAGWKRFFRHALPRFMELVARL